jgi:hypothetical protein
MADLCKTLQPAFSRYAWPLFLHPPRRASTRLKFLAMKAEKVMTRTRNGGSGTMTWPKSDVTFSGQEKPLPSPENFRLD